ncbi:MAG: hypothetical protein LBO20_06895 [Bifidobacteriaceae bacterium]|jgi:hypothetical protein|nr:hypothetical protein [Bifidobacteriaceae bacterium]
MAGEVSLLGVLGGLGEWTGVEAGALVSDAIVLPKGVDVEGKPTLWVRVSASVDRDFITRKGLLACALETDNPLARAAQ